MRNKINLSFLSMMLLLLVITACSASPKADATETPESIAIATESWTKTPTPTTIPSATPTVTSSPTIIPSPTFTSTPAPTPTAPPVSPEFTNLTLALDYNKDTLDPISPQDYFPLGVSYIAVVFDYLVPSWTTIHWYISDPDGTIKESGSVNLDPRKNINTFIIQPEMGLDEGIHEIQFEFDNEPVLNKQFDVYWNPTVWPVSIGTDVYSDYSVENDGNTFPYGTEFLAAVYPTINFIVGDEIFTEWFVNGEKLGEHQYVWDNSEWSSGMHVNKVDNQMSADQPLPIGNYELFVHVNGAKKQCKSFQIIEENAVSSESIDTPDSVLGCESFISEPSTANSPSTWDRYEVRTFNTLNNLVDEDIAFDTTHENTVYLEMSPDYQHPSRIKVIFTGNFRETPEATLEWIRMWMAALRPDVTDEQVFTLFGQEGLFMEGTTEYWLPIQNTLIPAMEDELSSESKVDLLVMWMGTVMVSGEIERIYLVNAFR